MKKSQALQIVADKINHCTLCPDLQKRTQTVPGCGAPNADIMFVGEAPGRHEDEQGLPFVGKAGQLLTNMITACGFKRGDVFICNILKCRPPNNRNPTEEEIKNCKKFINIQIEIIKPSYIICLGSIAAQTLLETDAPIGDLRGQLFTYRDSKLLATYHPAYLLRGSEEEKRQKKAAVQCDLHIFLEDYHDRTGRH